MFNILCCKGKPLTTNTIHLVCQEHRGWKPWALLLTTGSTSYTEIAASPGWLIAGSHNYREWSFCLFFKYAPSWASFLCDSGFQWQVKPVLPVHLNVRARRYSLQQMLHTESLTTLGPLFFTVNLIFKLNTSSEHSCLSKSDPLILSRSCTKKEKVNQRAKIQFFS